MEIVKIVKQRIVIDANLYSRYFVDMQGRVNGIPTGLSFEFRDSKCGNYVCIRHTVKAKHVPFSTGTSYANSLSIQCDVLKKCIGNYLAEQVVPNTYTDGRIGSKRTGKTNYAGVITPPGVHFRKMNDKCVGFNVSAIDSKTLKLKTEFWYCGTINTWRSRYFKTIKMVLKYKRANDKLLERIMVLVENK